MKPEAPGSRPTARKSSAASRKSKGAAVGGKVAFEATLQRAAARAGDPGGWLFLRLPAAASRRMPSRGMVWVEGRLNDASATVALQPDGEGGHWLKLDDALRQTLMVQAGDRVSAEISALPHDKAPECEPPDDLRQALEAAPSPVKEAWRDITPIARRDWIQWITAAKREETRARRIDAACDMLAKGKRRPCCFDRSGRFDGSLGCPAAADKPAGRAK